MEKDQHYLKTGTPENVRVALMKWKSLRDQIDPKKVMKGMFTGDELVKSSETGARRTAANFRTRGSQDKACHRGGPRKQRKGT